MGSDNVVLYIVCYARLGSHGWMVYTTRHTTNGTWSATRGSYNKLHGGREFVDSSSLGSRKGGRVQGSGIIGNNAGCRAR